MVIFQKKTRGKILFHKSPKSIAIVAFITCAVFVAPAYSKESSHNENHFAGGYAIVSGEWGSSNTSVSGNSQSFSNITKSEISPTVSLGYAFPIDSHWLVGLQANYELKKGEFGNGTSGTQNIAIEQKDHFSIAVEPGYALSNRTLLFGILAYHSTRATLDATGAPNEAKGSATLSGFGYGFGAKYALTEHFFGVVDFQRVNYNSATIEGYKFKPNTNTVALGIGYHF
jgi:opacity protein-like surface antigen